MGHRLNALTTTWNSSGGTGWQHLAVRCRACVNTLLLLMVMLGLWEPLACMRYCENWARLHVQRVSSSDPLDQRLQADIATTTIDQSSSELGRSGTTFFQNLYICSTSPMQNGPSDTPAHVLHHDHLATAVTVAAFVLVFLIQTYVLPSLPTPPQRTLPPPLRPPIMAAS